MKSLLALSLMAGTAAFSIAISGNANRVSPQQLADYSYQLYSLKKPVAPPNSPLPGLLAGSFFLASAGCLVGYWLSTKPEPTANLQQPTANPTANLQQPTAALTPVEELFHRLKTECPDLLRLVNSHPIRLVGIQRTGKSSFARKLVLLRAIISPTPGHKIRWATPHTERDNPVPPIFNPFGTSESGAKDYPQIERIWKQVQDRIDRNEFVNESIVWDEFGGYEAFQDKELLGDSLRSVLREAKKNGYGPIFIAHGDTAMFYPGITGIVTTIKNSTIKIETRGREVDDFGTIAPTGEVVIHWLQENEEGERVTHLRLPRWLSEDRLIKILQWKQEQENPAPVEKEKEPANVSVQELEALFAASASPASVDLPAEYREAQDLSLMQAIHQFAQEKGKEVAARSIQQSGRSNWKDLKPDQIRQYFIKMQNLGWGTTVGSGSNLKYIAHTSPEN